MKTRFLKEVPPVCFRDFMEANDLTLVVEECFKTNGCPYTKATIENKKQRKAFRVKMFDGEHENETVFGVGTDPPLVDAAIAALVSELSGHKVHFGRASLVVPTLKPWTGPLWDAEMD